MTLRALFDLRQTHSSYACSKNSVEQNAKIQKHALRPGTRVFVFFKEKNYFFSSVLGSGA